MLSTSRSIFTRIALLGTAYFLSEDRKYTDRAIMEMESAASFSDWHPAHFLDVGELTFAMAIGYDWFYNQMTEEQRKTIAEAIIKKGLEPGWNPKYWWNWTNNWNPVCNAGMVAGALALADQEPELAEKTIRRAIEMVPASIKIGYQPEGAYPEGPMYWGYGTMFTTLLIDMLENALGSDFGLYEFKGLRRTGDYVQAVTSPSGNWFNYSDCNEKRELSFVMTYLAHRFERPDWFDQTEQKLLTEYSRHRYPEYTESRCVQTIPFVLLYLDFPLRNQQAPLAYHSGNTAVSPLAVHRSDYSEDAAWLALKGGNGAVPHGHMDGGSFVFESKGVRWVTDLGYDSYGILEKKGIGIWDNSQNSTRWNVFRYGKDSHNIIQIDGKRQNVSKGKATITAFTESGSVLDLTPLYTPSAQKVTRALSLLPDGGMKCVDRLSGLKPGSVVKWQFCTKVRLTPGEDGSVLLQRNKKTMKVKNNMNAAWQIKNDEELRNPEYDLPNPGLKMVSFSVTVPENGEVEYEVTFNPQK